MELGSSATEDRLIVLGASSVGKTSIINRLTADSFDAKEPTTVAASFIRHEETVGKETIVMQIWDTAGQEKYMSLGRMYYRGSIAAVVVFDLTQPKTFDALSDWVRGFIELAGDDVVIFALGNKADLTDGIKVGEPAIQEWLSSRPEPVQYFRTSAVDGSGISQAFKSLAEELLRRRSAQCSQCTDDISLTTDDPEAKRCC
jgi:small GTP-binding protein